MCGILGVLNGENYSHAISKVCDYMRQGAITGILRGTDSTGLMQVSKDHNVRVHKLPIDGINFSLTKRSQQFFGATDSSFATILHHRAATHGEVTYDNSHPFDHEVSGRYVVGVHNGTLYSWQRKEDGVDFNVDSDWLYYRIARDGAKQALEEVNGAYALVWWDASTQRINLASNGQRTIYFAPVIGRNIMLVASEAGMLHWLADRNDFKLEEMLFPRSDQIYHFNSKDVRAYTTTTLEPKKTVVQGGTTTPFRQADRSAIGHTQTEVARLTGPSATGPGGTEYYGAAASERLSTIGLAIGDEVEVFYDAGTIKLNSNDTDVHCEWLDKHANYGAAIMKNLPGATRYNLAKASSCLAKVVGAKQMFDADGSPNGYMVIVGAPWKLQLVLDEKEPVVDGPRQRKLNAEQFAELASKGCVYCSQVVEFADAAAGKITWVGETPVCPDCNNTSVPMSVQM